MKAPATLLRHAAPRVLDRALALTGQVGARQREGSVLRARVRGSRPAPYRVRVDLGAGTWTCSCPDDLNALCKHVAAVLLVAADAWTSFEPATAAPRRLPDPRGWADADVEALLERLLEHHPAVVADWAREVVEERLEDGDWPEG